MTDNTWPTVDPELIDDVTLYSAKLIIPVTGPVIIDGAVAIHGDRVVHVGKRRWVLKALKQEMTAHGTIHERHWDGVLTPGLINAHTHLQYSGMVQVGQGTYDRFRAWELAFNEVYAEAQKTQPWKQWAEDGARQMVESGTTAAADIVTDLDAAGALASQGMHGIAYWEVMGWHNAEWMEKGRTELIRQLRRMNEEQLPNLGISPHAPYTLESEPFVDLPDIARQLNMRLHIHLAETPLEAGTYPPVLTTYSAADWSGNLPAAQGSGQRRLRHPVRRSAWLAWTGCAHCTRRVGQWRGSAYSTSARRGRGLVPPIESHYQHRQRCTGARIPRGRQSGKRGHRFALQHADPRSA